MKKTSRLLFIIVGLLVVAGIAYGINRFIKNQKEEVPKAVDVFSMSQKDTSSTTTENPQEQATGSVKKDPATSTTPPTATPPSLPPELNFAMDFYPQAPFGNWDYPWQEACEEASALLVANTYLKHNWTANEFNQQILQLVTWEKKTFGQYEHTTVKETAQILNDYLGLKTIIHENPSFEDVQTILNKGHLIIAPFAGKQVGNPYYKNGGPVYHMMVIKGYKQGKKIITEDVGTKRGEDYVYSWTTAQNALHDYAEPISKGEKRIIEVLPPLE